MGANEVGMKVLTYDPRKNKLVFAGYTKGDTFVKEVTAKHFMKVEQGYGIQEDVIQKLMKIECKTIRIETPAGAYETAFSDWLGISPKDYGNGMQRFKALKTMWKVGKSKQNKLL